MDVKHRDVIVAQSEALTGILGETPGIQLPGDKSLSHRAALFAALAEGESRIENFQVSGVTDVMLQALTAVGVDWRLEGTSLFVNGKGAYGLKAPVDSIYCGNSATTIRLLSGALAASGIPATLTGSAGLKSRPMGRIVEPLRRLGVSVQASDSGTAPLILAARQPDEKLQGTDIVLPVASAQVKSCLLLAALAARGETRLHEPGPSRDHTERMLSSMGVRVAKEEHVMENGKRDYVTRLLPPEPLKLRPLSMRLPGDISAAAFLIVAALITTGSEITIRGVGLNPSRTGLLDVLIKMGADIRISGDTIQGGEPVGNLTIRYSSLRGFSFDMEDAETLVVRMIDEFPAFAVAAAYASGLTVVRGAGELRLKESDRISALCAELRAIGVEVTETHDGFEIQGGAPIRGGIVQTHGDHRLAMSLAVAGLAAHGGVRVQNAEIIGESFPGFVTLLRSLGANIYEIPGGELVEA